MTETVVHMKLYLMTKRLVPVPMMRRTETMIEIGEGCSATMFASRKTVFVTVKF